ncbi:MAG: CopG family transcriptional regulator [Gammaproteobacteria bacterium]
MSTITVRLPDQLMREVEGKAKLLHLAKTAYIRRAIERMNQAIELEEQKKRLQKASKKVRKDSMRINKEFEAFEGDVDD